MNIQSHFICALLFLLILISCKQVEKPDLEKERIETQEQFLSLIDSLNISFETAEELYLKSFSGDGDVHPYDSVRNQLISSETVDLASSEEILLFNTSVPLNSDLSLNHLYNYYSNNIEKVTALFNSNLNNVSINNIKINGLRYFPDRDLYLDDTFAKKVISNKYSDTQFLSEMKNHRLKNQSDFKNLNKEVLIKSSNVSRFIRFYLTGTEVIVQKASYFKKPILLFPDTIILNCSGLLKTADPSYKIILTINGKTHTIDATATEKMFALKNIKIPFSKFFNSTDYQK